MLGKPTKPTKPAKPTTQGRVIKPFLALLAAQAPKVHPNGVPTTLLCIDPGHTTGWASFQEGKPSKCGHLSTPQGSPSNLPKLLTAVKPTLVLCEEYILYPWAAKASSWSEFPTIQLIGALKLLCQQANLPIQFQSTQLVKGFCTDDKLKSWGFHQTSKRHANDAIRHGCYYLLFGQTRRKARKNTSG